MTKTETAFLQHLQAITVDQLRAAFENAGYTYETGELRGSVGCSLLLEGVHEPLCARTGTMRDGAAMFDFRFQDEDGHWTNGSAFVRFEHGQLVAEH